MVTALFDQLFGELLASAMPIPPFLLRVLRLARILRVVRLLKSLKGLRSLIMTLVGAAPSLVNVGCLLCLVILVYAILGLQFFTCAAALACACAQVCMASNSPLAWGMLTAAGSFVMHDPELGDEELSSARNFETLGSASLVLVQCLTGDGWASVLDDLMVSVHRGCHATAGIDDVAAYKQFHSDCGSWLALPYLISFTVVGQLIMLNLVRTPHCFASLLHASSNALHSM